MAHAGDGCFGPRLVPSWWVPWVAILASGVVEAQIAGGDAFANVDLARRCATAPDWAEGPDDASCAPLLQVEPFAAQVLCL